MQLRNVTYENSEWFFVFGSFLGALLWITGKTQTHSFVYLDLVPIAVALFRIFFSSPYAKTSICLAEEEEV